jgi:SOS-response transcriptional repressor LexA
MTDSTPTHVTARLAALRERSGLSMDNLAKRMGRRGASSIQRYFNEAQHPKPYLDLGLVDALIGALAGLGNPPITPDEVQALAWDVAALPRVRPEPVLATQTWPRPAVGGEIARVVELRNSSLIKDLPIWGEARGGEDGLFFNNGAPSKAMIYRPPEMVGIEGAYGVYVNGDSMRPRFKHGELVYVNPIKPVSPGDDIVIQLRDGQGFIKELVRLTDKALVCRQYSPEETEFCYKRADVRSIHLIVFGTKTRG